MPTLVSTGQITITDVTDGLNARLSSESHLIPADTDGSSGDFTGCATTMSVFLGKNDDSANWSYSAAPTAGLTGSLVGRTYTVTDMSTDAGYVDITASRAGYASLTSRFSVTKAKRGMAGPAITIVSSGQGFTFRDNVAFPAEQSMSFTVIRQNAYGPVEFYATGGATLTTDDGQLLLSNYTAGVPGCGEGETCYLDLAGFGDNQQVTITAVVGELTATKTIVRLDFSTAEAGATVGAPAGTLVGGQLAELLVSDATAAKSGAETANALISDIASDSKLTPTEKLGVKREWDALVGEKAGINSQAAAFSITAENTAYNNAYTALDTYLSPLLASLTTTSDITGSTMRTNFSTLYTTRQALLNKIADEAGNRAAWSTVSGSGKPLDNAGKVLDTRSVNGPPSSYAVGNHREFKFCATVGITTSATYCVVETIKGWTDGSGGEATQWAYVTSGEVWKRSASNSATSWGAWVRDIDRNLYTGALDATRNVHRGNWANATAYALGDTVISGGYGWSCVLAHTSAAGTNNPPTYPTASNTWWTLAAVKGEDAKVAMLTASSFVFRIAQDGTVSPSSIALTALGQNLAGSPTFTVTSGTAALTGTGEARVLNAASLTSDQATIKITWDGKEDYVTITKVKEGTNGITVVASNEAHALPAAVDGMVSTYSGSGTTIQAYEGSTALSASSSAVVSAFRIGTITQSPAATITIGAVSYAGSTATIAAHSAMAAGTDSVTLTIPVTVYRADGTSSTFTKTQTISKAKTGATGAAGSNGLTVVMSNESHTLPAGSDGTVSSYTNSGTTIQVYEGATLLTAGGSANGSFTVGAATQAPAATLTVGAVSYAGNTATVAVHSAMAVGTDSVTLTFPITVKRADGTTATINKTQTLTKAKTGAVGAQGPSVTITSSRAASFTSTDGALDGSQADITFTAIVSGISSPTYAWTFSGLQSNPTASTTSTQVITAAQFGTSKSATVKCTVSGNNNYVDIVTIVRLEKSTAAAGANQTYVDGNGNLQGVSSGAGTGVANGNIILNQDGTLTGGGASQQVNLTHIPGMLTADRIETGTLTADTKIKVGTGVDGVLIDATTQSVSAQSAAGVYCYLFYTGSSAPAKPTAMSNINQTPPSGWYGRPLPSWTLPVYRVKALILDQTGAIGAWSNVEKIHGSNYTAGTYSNWNYKVSTSKTVPPDPAAPWSQVPPEVAAGEYLWTRKTAGTTEKKTPFRVSGYTGDDVYDALYFGKLGAGNYGIVGRSSPTSVMFQLDSAGLYIKPNSESIFAFGGAYRWETIREGTEPQSFLGATPSSTGTVTTYIKLADFVSDTEVFYAKISGRFSRFTISTATYSAQSYYSIYLALQVYYDMNSGGTVSLGTTVISSDTNDSTNFAAASRASVIVDTTGATAGSVGVFLKLVSRVMYSFDNPTYSDATDHSYIVWRKNF